MKKYRCFRVAALSAALFASLQMSAAAPERADVVVIGGTHAGVEAALSARKALSRRSPPRIRAARETRARKEPLRLRRTHFPQPTKGISA